MAMTNEEKRQHLDDIRKKIEYGMQLYHERFWEEARRKNWRVAIAQNGKVVVVNAADIK